MRGICRQAGWVMLVLAFAGRAMSGPGDVKLERHFSIAIEQGGKEVVIRDHEATIERKTFTIVVRFNRPDNVLVNSSFKSDSFDAAKQGMTLGEIDGFQSTGMAEDDFNPDRELLMRDDAPHCWQYEGEKSHRFNRVEKAGGVIVCRRDVAQFYLLEEEKDPAPTVRVEDTKEAALYLVFAHARLSARAGADEDEIQWDEDQREYVKLTFEARAEARDRR